MWGWGQGGEGQGFQVGLCLGPRLPAPGSTSRSVPASVCIPERSPQFFAPHRASCKVSASERAGEEAAGVS